MGRFSKNRVSQGPGDNHNKQIVAKTITQEIIHENLLKESNPSKPNLFGRSSYQFCSVVYLLLFSCYGLAFWIPKWITSVPETKPTVPLTPIRTNVTYQPESNFHSIPINLNFNVSYAYSHLEIITLQPHQFNMPYNDKVHDYIRSFGQLLQQQYQHVEVDPLVYNLTFIGTSTPSGQFGINNVTGYFEANNIIIKVKGTQSTNALLISAHFDSVPLSYGANDNGMGVATALEILRLLAQNPPPHDVIFNFNNHEV